MRDRFDAVSMALGGSPLDLPAPSGAAPLPLEAQARMIGSYQWLERRLFEVLGGWVSSEPVAEAAAIFDVYAQQHAWHAELFGERLPVADSIDVDALAVPSSVEVDRLLAVLAGVVRLGDPQPVVAGDGGGSGAGPGASGTLLRAGGTLLRLAGMARVVLPRLIAGYGLHARRVSTVAEAPLGRCLRLVLRDELEQWQAFETLTEALLRRPHDIVVVTGYQQQLEQMVAESGVGLVPWPDGPESAPPATGPDPGGDTVPAPPGPPPAPPVVAPPTGSLWASGQRSAAPAPPAASVAAPPPPPAGPGAVPPPPPPARGWGSGPPTVP